MSPAPLTFDAPATIAAQLEARAAHPEVAERVFLRHGDRTWTYRETRDACVRMAHLLRGRLGRIDEHRPGHVAMLLENRVELLHLFGGCAYAGLTLFGLNTGLRGETLAGVLDHSGARVLVVEERFLPEIERIRRRLEHVPPPSILVVRTGEGDLPLGSDLESCLREEVAGPGESLPSPDVPVDPDDNLMVIYTSGTTGLPKGINNSHAKLLMIGLAVSSNMGMGADDVGYASMPLFHSNSIFLGLMPAFRVGGSLGIRERFSASGFVPDVLRYGVTFWNYVGEPIHYVLRAIEREYGRDVDRIHDELTRNPRNRLRWALGNGASPPDIDRFMNWLGLEDVFELYGSTEAAISTFRRKGDPRGSVGEILDPQVKILDESGEECPPTRPDEEGKIINYREAVGEICRVAGDTGLFQGYFGDSDASASKYRDGVYHSSDLGHVVLHDGKRYLYFDGRTDDWIRKDGENFSAAQVARLLEEHPGIDLAAAYGVPCPVSDELVMVALKLRPGAGFDPEKLFGWCRDQVRHGGMDPKWIPDFVRIVDEFEYTETQKILVRTLKADHFDRSRLPGATVFWRERGDARFKPFTAEDFSALRREFAASERAHLLAR